MTDTLLREQRCIKCGELTRRIVTHGDRYVCDREACLTAAIREALESLGITPEATLVASGLRYVRESFDAR